MKQSTTSSSRRRWSFRLCAVLLGLSPFLVLEATLRWNRADSEIPADPYVAFGAVHDLFELDDRDQMYRTARARQILFGAQEFPADKPPNGYRVFCLGGSTVRGRPFHVETAFPHWLQLELQGLDASKQFEAINCGGLSYASYRLRFILAEVLDYDPDLIILAMGHNEFLEDRTYQSQKAQTAAWSWIRARTSQLETVRHARRAWGRKREVTTLNEEVTARLDAESGYASYHRDEAWRRDVLQHFKDTLRDMVSMCQARGVPVVLVQLGSNLRDNPPFKSEHQAGLDDALRVQWQRAFDRAASTPDPARALDAYREAESIDDQYALLSFRMARCFDRLGDFEQARRYYERAKELDVCPLRILDEAAKTVETAARSMGVPLVDAARHLETRSAQGIPGYDWYTDHVHPSIMAHQAIATTIAKTLGEQQLIDKTTLDRPDAQRRQAARRHFASLPSNYFGNGRRRVGWLEQWARREKHEQESEPVDARGRLHRGFRRYQFEEYDLAWSDFEQALRDDPRQTRGLLEFAVNLVRYGRPDAARRLLNRLFDQPQATPIRDDILFGQYITALERGDGQEAASLWQQHRVAFERLRDSPWLDVAPRALERVGEEGPLP